MKKLIFVYNADAGFFNMVTDMAHKIFSPETYPCSLCDLTYGVFKIRPEWDDFVQNAPVPFVFLHRDEFHQQYPDATAIPLPVVLLEAQPEETAVIVSADVLNRLESIEALKQQVLDSLKA